MMLFVSDRIHFHFLSLLTSTLSSLSQVRRCGKTFPLSNLINSSPAFFFCCALSSFHQLPTFSLSFFLTIWKLYFYLKQSNIRLSSLRGKEMEMEKTKKKFETHNEFHENVVVSYRWAFELIHFPIRCAFLTAIVVCSLFDVVLFWILKSHSYTYLKLLTQLSLMCMKILRRGKQNFK